MIYRSGLVPPCATQGWARYSYVTLQGHFLKVFFFFVQYPQHLLAPRYFFSWFSGWKVKALVHLLLFILFKAVSMSEIIKREDKRVKAMGIIYVLLKPQFKWSKGRVFSLRGLGCLPGNPCYGIAWEWVWEKKKELKNPGDFFHSFQLLESFISCIWIRNIGLFLGFFLFVPGVHLQLLFCLWV